MADRNSKVMYLSYDGLTDPLGQSQILPYLLGLADSGFDISVVSFEKREKYEHEKKLVAKAIGGRIKWIPLRYHKRPPVLSTLVDLKSLLQTAVRLQKEEGFAIVHCRSYVTSLVGLRLKRKFGLKFIFDMRGFWADERVEGGLWNLNNPLFRLVYKYFKRKEREFLREADYVISLTENAKAEIESWKVTTAQVTVIPTCVDLELFDPKKINKDDQDFLRKRLGLHPSDFVLLYLGSWGTWYLTDEMLSFFAALKKQKPEAKFLIVTPDMVSLTAFDYKTDVIVERAARQEVPLFISIADAAVFFIKPSFSKKASSATKMGEIMAMEKPIVTNPGWGDVEEIIGNYMRGVLVNASQPALRSTAETLIKLENVSNLEWVRDRFSLQTGIKSYSMIYSEVLSG